MISIGQTEFQPLCDMPECARQPIVILGSLSYTEIMLEKSYMYWCSHITFFFFIGAGYIDVI